MRIYTYIRVYIIIFFTYFFLILLHQVCMRTVCHAGVLGNISHSETYLEQATETHSSLLLRQRSSFLLSLSAHYDRLPICLHFLAFCFLGWK